MAEQSFLFDFSRSPTFFENFNESFSLTDMNTSDSETVLENFQLVLASYCDDNIANCLDADGCLSSSVTVAKSIENVDLINTIGLDYIIDDYGDAIISLHDETTFVVGDTNIPLKAVFLQTLDGYVMGYSIMERAIPVTNKVVFDEDVIFWDITRIKV